MASLNDGLRPGHPEHIHHPDDGRGYRRVLVDGVEIHSVFYADTILGYIRRHVPGASGGLFTLPPEYDTVAWVEAYGRVSVELKETK